MLYLLVCVFFVYAIYTFWDFDRAVKKFHYLIDNTRVEVRRAQEEDHEEDRGSV